MWVSKTGNPVEAEMANVSNREAYELSCGCTLSSIQERQKLGKESA